MCPASTARAWVAASPTSRADRPACSISFQPPLGSLAASTIPACSCSWAPWEGPSSAACSPARRQCSAAAAGNSCANARWASPASRGPAGADLPLDDPLASRLRAVAAGAADDPTALVRAALAVEEVFGRDLRQDAGLVEQLTQASARIARHGVRAALAD